MRAILPVGFSLVSLLAACGGAAVTGTGAGATGGGTTTTTPLGDGGCITPTLGEACSASSPPACQPPDPCCTGYEWSCDTSTGTWQQLGLGCACQSAPTPFYCGPTLNVECVPGQYCLNQAPADGGDTVYTCVQIPSVCTNTPTCDCIQQAAEAQNPGCATAAGGECAMTSSSGSGTDNVTLSCSGG